MTILIVYGYVGRIIWKENPWSACADLIARVCGISVVDPLEKPESADSGDNPVWPDKLRLVRTLPYGDVMAIEQIWEKLSIGETPRKVCRDSKMLMEYEKALLAMTAN